LGIRKVNPFLINKSVDTPKTTAYLSSNKRKIYILIVLQLRKHGLCH
jgi:hypothetical protein